MTEPARRKPGGGWLGFSKPALIIHGALAVVTLGLWLLVPLAILAWRHGSKVGRIISYALWAIVAVIVLSVAIAFLSTSGDGDERSAPQAQQADPQPPPPAAAAEPPPTPEPPPPAPEPPPPPPPPPAEVDTGRMSVSEYEQFQRVHSEFVDESLQFSEGLQKCSVIGQTGDFAEFSRCMDEAFSGLEEDALTAYAVADGLTGDTAKKCQAALRSYLKVLDALYSLSEELHKQGSNLQFEAMSAAANQLPQRSRRYRKFSTNALAACEPR